MKKDNKQHNIYVNIVVEYFMHVKINKKDYDKLLNDGMLPEEFFYQTDLRVQTVYYQISNFILILKLVKSYFQTIKKRNLQYIMLIN